MSPRSSGDRALPSGGRSTGSNPVGGTPDCSRRNIDEALGRGKSPLIPIFFPIHPCVWACEQGELRTSRIVRISDLLGKGASPMDWRHQSACRDEDPELFFPVGNTGPAITQIEEAKKVCNRCIVKDACLAWALESGQDAGVWGGLSEDERRALKRRAARNRARLMDNGLSN